MKWYTVDGPNKGALEEISPEILPGTMVIRPLECTKVAVTDIAPMQEIKQAVDCVSDQKTLAVLVFDLCMICVHVGKDGKVGERCPVTILYTNNYVAIAGQTFKGAIYKTEDGFAVMATLDTEIEMVTICQDLINKGEI